MHIGAQGGLALSNETSELDQSINIILSTTPGELVRVDERAATLGGAQIAAANDLPARCYVGSAAAVIDAWAAATASRSPIATVASAAIARASSAPTTRRLGDQVAT